MAQVNSRILDIITRFILEARKYNINIQQAILFGSYAKGTNNEFSDIDLAIVSTDFVGSRFFDNQKISRPKLNISYELETHPYRPEDFTKDNPFVEEILHSGIRIL